MNYKVILKYWATFVLLISFIGAHALENNNHLISVQEVYDVHYNATDVVVIDLRRLEDYSKSHVVGAVNIWRSAYVDTSFIYGGMMPSRKQFQEVLSVLGVKTNDKILLYDDRGGCEAARFWWILKIYGHSNAFVIDGGFEAMAINNSKIAVSFSPPVHSNYEFPETEDHTLWASLNDVKKALLDTEYNVNELKNTGFQDVFSNSDSKKLINTINTAKKDELNEKAKFFNNYLNY